MEKKGGGRLEKGGMGENGEARWGGTTGGYAKIVSDRCDGTYILTRTPIHTPTHTPTLPFFPPHRSLPAAP